jgi:hypothetical protein
VRASKFFLLAVFGFSNVVAKDFRPPAVAVGCKQSVFQRVVHGRSPYRRRYPYWTGTPQSLGSLVRVDDKPYRIMGNEARKIPAMEQRKVQVLPTRTTYEFEAGGVGIMLAFMTPGCCPIWI